MDPWYAIVDGSGVLVSTGTVIADAEQLAANGLTAIKIDGPPGDREWDVATRAFRAPAPAPTVLSRLGFVQRFTASEFMAIKNSHDVNVQFFLYQLENAETVMPSHTIVQQGIAYLTGLGLLTSERATLIGAE